MRMNSRNSSVETASGRGRSHSENTCRPNLYYVQWPVPIGPEQTFIIRCVIQAAQQSMFLLSSTLSC